MRLLEIPPNSHRRPRRMITRWQIVDGDKARHRLWTIMDCCCCGSTLDAVDGLWLLRSLRSRTSIFIPIYRPSVSCHGRLTILPTGFAPQHNMAADRVVFWVPPVAFSPLEWAPDWGWEVSPLALVLSFLTLSAFFVVCNAPNRARPVQNSSITTTSTAEVAFVAWTLVLDDCCSNCCSKLDDSSKIFCIRYLE